MSPRALLILGVLALAAVVGVWLTHGDREDPPAVTGNPLVPGLLDELNEVSAVTIRRAGGEVVARLEREAEGDWRVRNRWDYPADHGLLRGMLIALGEARRAEGRTSNPEHWQRLGVEEIDDADATGMEVELEGDGLSHRVIIGRQAGAGEGTFARLADSDASWLIDQRIDRYHAIGDWLDSRVVDIPVDDVVAVDLEPEAGGSVSVRPEPESVAGFELVGVPADAELLTPTIARSLVRVVTELEFIDVRPRSDAEPLEPVGVARYEARDGFVLYIHSYTLPEDGNAGAVRFEAEATEDADEAVRERAATLTRQWQGWVYRLPEHKYVNATQTLDGVVVDSTTP